jgi:phosphate:Na+ symporter
MLETVLMILGGLALFLFAVNSLSDIIKDILGDRAQELLVRFTRNTFTAIVTGAVVTTLLDSSSAVIIITIVLVNANVLTFKNAMGIVMGANIGTTVSSQIIAMDIGKYSPIFLIIGLILLMVAKSDQLSKTGRAIMYFGVLFFGLYTMERAVEPLRDEPYFFEWIERMHNPLTGTLTGAVITLIIQSSSATVGMAIVLAKKSIIDVGVGIALMMGAELGTCSDTLLATIKGNREGVKTGLFHLGFNLFSIILGLVFFYPFCNFVIWLSGSAAPERILANAHMIFNISGVVILAWFVGYFEKGLNYLLPSKKIA